MSTAIADLVEIVEALPSTLQEKAIEHLREYIADLQDEHGMSRLVEPSPR